MVIGMSSTLLWGVVGYIAHAVIFGGTYIYVLLTGETTAGFSSMS